MAQAGLINKLFERFGRHLEAAGYIARGGQSLTPRLCRCPRNTKEENEAIRAGKTPQGWERQPAQHAQKDKDERWTKKKDESFYGYKNHLGVDKVHKLIRKWDATDASVHDSQKMDAVLDLSQPARGVWADSAYRSAQIEADLKAKGTPQRPGWKAECSPKSNSIPNSLPFLPYRQSRFVLPPMKLKSQNCWLRKAQPQSRWHRYMVGCRRIDHSGGTCFWQIGSEVPVPVIRAARDTATFGSARAPIVIFRVSQSERANMLPCHKTSHARARTGLPANND